MGTVLAIGGLLAAVVVPLMLRKRKILRYEYELERLLFLDAEARESVQAVYKGERRVESIDRVTVRFINSGNEAIRSDDFQSALTIDIGTGAEALEGEVTDSQPGDIAVELCVAGEEVRVVTGLLNPRDTFAISVLVGDFGGTVSVNGRIEGARIERYPDGEVMKFGSLVLGFVCQVSGIMCQWAFDLLAYGFLLLIAGWCLTGLGWTGDWFGAAHRALLRLPKV